VTSLETDHLDCYRDLDDIKSAFIQFAGKVPFYGFVVLCLDEPALQDICRRSRRKIVTYGLNGQADLQAVDIVHRQNMMKFTVLSNGKELEGSNSRFPGSITSRTRWRPPPSDSNCMSPFSKVKAGSRSLPGSSAGGR